MSTEFDRFSAAFAERFRGSFDAVKERLATHADFIASLGAPVGPLIDVGTGRGEWVELARQRGWDCTGVESNAAIVAQARSRGLDIKEADGLQYLAAAQPESIGAITAFHFIEHLETDQLLAFFREAHRCLMHRGLLLLEWPNVENLRVAAYTFWLDPTHRSPLPPELVAFMAEYAGFTDIRLVRLDQGKIVEHPALDIALYAVKP